jgi:hypothetical protein
MTFDTEMRHSSITGEKKCATNCKSAVEGHGVHRTGGAIGGLLGITTTTTTRAPTTATKVIFFLF